MLGVLSRTASLCFSVPPLRNGDVCPEDTLTEERLPRAVRAMSGKATSTRQRCGNRNVPATRAAMRRRSMNGTSVGVGCGTKRIDGQAFGSEGKWRRPRRREVHE